MADMPQANPVPDKPPLHLRGGYLVIAAPEDPVEACFAAPAIRALRHARPHATIALTTPATLAPLWRRVPGITHLVPYPSSASARVVARLLIDTGVRYESSIAWAPSAAAKAFSRLGIQQRFGYRLTKLTSHLNEPLPFTQPFGPPAHRVRFYLALLEKLQVEAMVPSSFRTPPLPDRPSVPRVALAPGSEFGKSYRWPTDRFAEVARTLLQEGHDVLIVGPEARAFASQLGGDAPFLDESADLEQVLASLAGSSMLLASDGILPHFAAHLGLPTAVLFGPGNPETRRPLGRIHRVLNAHVECSPCGLPKCPLDHRCMLELTTAEVHRAVLDLLGQPV